MRFIDKHNFLLLILFVACLIAVRGLFRTTAIAGHDTASYPVTQFQFHQNIKEGVVFPRWAPDMRYGYGQPKLQFRPPLLHYIAELVYVVTGNPFFSINLALVFLVFSAGVGMYLFARTLTKMEASLIAATAYVTFNYFLANIYLRGAYYEVAAYACMPWILWGQSVYFKEGPIRNVPVFVGGIAWACIVCAHPQICFFFMPVAMAHVLFNWYETGRRRGAIYAIAVSCSGILIAAPYVYVAIRELPLVRMQIFSTALEAYPHHFISVRDLFTETWPAKYIEYSWIDYLGRPRHREMRGLNWWCVCILFLVPLFWFIRRKCWDEFNRRSIFYYLILVLTLVIALPVSKGIWAHVTIMHTFNFPWRILGVSSLCLAILGGLLVEDVFCRFNVKKNTQVIVTVIITLLMIISIFFKTCGWPGEKWLTSDLITKDAIRNTEGVPQQFYTPFWVKNYAVRSSSEPLKILSGTADVRLTEQSATRWIIDVDAVTPARIEVCHYYYPGWKIYGLKEKPITPDILDPEGTMSFQVAPGKCRLELRFDLTPARIQGYWLSVLGVLILFYYTFVSTRFLKV